MTGKDEVRADEHQGRLRVESLANGLYAPVRRSLFVDLGLLAVTLVLTLAAASATGRGEIVAGVAGAGAVLAAGSGWGWLADRNRRAAFEVLLDHQFREQRLWVEKTGTKLPSTVRGAKRWLQQHQGRPGSASMLARLGRIAEARTAARDAGVETPEDAFELELIERQLDLFEGRRPETSTLHAQWRELPATPVRDLKRWCLAVLEAERAVDDGENGWRILASARRDNASVHERASATTYARNLVILHVGVALLMWGLAAWAFL